MFKPLLALFLVVLVSVNAIDFDNTDCNGTAAATDKPSGELDINSPEKNLMPGKTCEWLINATAITTNRFLHFDLIQNLVLEANDSIVITDGGNKTLYEGKGYHWPGVILLGDVTVVNVKLILSNITFARIWNGFQYKTNENSVQIQNIESTGRYVFPYNDFDKGKDFTIILAAKQKSKNLLIDLESLTFDDGSVTFDKVDKYANQKFDGKTTDPKSPDFLLSTEQQINIKINLKKIKAKGIQMYIDLVDSFCSQYQNLKDLDKENFTYNIHLPNQTTLNTLSNYKCLNIFEHEKTSAKFLLDLEKFKFINTGDLITVLDGNTRNSQTLAVIESTFIDIYWRNVYTYSSANKIWILFNSPQVVNRTTESDNTFGVKSVSQGKSFVFDSITTNVTLELNTRSKPQMPVVFTYVASPDKQIVIDLPDKPLPGDPKAGIVLGLSDDTMSRSEQRFIKLSAEQYTPDIIASDNNQLKVVFNQLVDITATVFTVDKGCHSTYMGNSGASYSPSGGCKGICSWTIPKRDNSNGTYVLQFSHLNLQKKSDELKIDMLGKNVVNVLNLTGPLMTTTFPDLNLDANQTYALYTYRKGCDNSSIDGSQLIGVSLVFVDKDLTTEEIVLNKDQSEVLKTLNYPNYYSIGSDQLWRIDAPVNQTGMALLTFTDFDLNPSHKLDIVSKNLTADLTTCDLSEVSDNLVELPLFLNLTSRSIDNARLPFSGRGFSANLTSVSCGQALKLDKQHLVISTPSDLKGISKCIWTVTTDNPNKTSIGLIAFNYTHGKDFDEKNLKIYDSNTIRDNKMVNSSYFKPPNSTEMSSSTNYLIIEYTISDKKDIGLNLTLEPRVCEQKCFNKKRCLLKEFSCNNINDCGDFTDEYLCDNGKPVPVPPPDTPTIVYHSGVNGWVVFLVICPLCIGIGVLGTLFGPQLLSRVGRGRYREFQDFSEVS